MCLIKTVAEEKIKVISWKPQDINAIERRVYITKKERKNELRKEIMLQKGYRFVILHKHNDHLIHYWFT